MAQLDLMSQDWHLQNKGPNCWQCRSFAITWDIKNPYGCNLMGFKSRLLPSIEGCAFCHFYDKTGLGSLKNRLSVFRLFTLN